MLPIRWPRAKTGRPYSHTSAAPTLRKPAGPAAARSASASTDRRARGRSITRLPSSTQTPVSGTAFDPSRRRMCPLDVSMTSSCAAARVRRAERAFPSSVCARMTLKPITSAVRLAATALSTTTRSRRLISLDAVADAVHGAYLGCAVDLLELASDTRDVRVECVLPHDGAVRPAGADELAPPNRFARPREQQREQTELGRGQRYFDTVGRHGVRDRVEHDAPLPRMPKSHRPGGGAPGCARRARPAQTAWRRSRLRPRRNRRPGRRRHRVR